VKVTLKDYQADAVEDVLANLKRARDAFKSEGQLSSFSLAATTGAGKTVMAAAAIEALFWGNDTFDFEPDLGAVVLWFSDDPSLNLQTFNRLRQASEKFTYSNLKPIEPPFSTPRLDPGKVYFLALPPRRGRAGRGKQLGGDDERRSRRHVDARPRGPHDGPPHGGRAGPPLPAEVPRLALGEHAPHAAGLL
jgi:hypothetical protein